jgi:hypothetical protein
VYSISVDGSSVDGIGDCAKLSTYAAIAVQAPRYYTISVKNSLRSSTLLTRTLKRTDIWRLLSDTILDIELASVGPDMLKG